MPGYQQLPTAQVATQPLLSAPPPTQYQQPLLGQAPPQAPPQQYSAQPTVPTMTMVQVCTVRCKDKSSGILCIAHTCVWLL